MIKRNTRRNSNKLLVGINTSCNKDNILPEVLKKCNIDSIIFEFCNRALTEASDPLSMLCPFVNLETSDWDGITVVSA